MNKAQPSFFVMNRDFKPARLIVKLRDFLVRGGRPHGQVNVSVLPVNQGFQLVSNENPVITPGGMYAFYSIEDGYFQIQITTLYYLSKKFTVTLPFNPIPPNTNLHIDDELILSKDGQIVVATVRLLPAPAYVFSPGMTIIRVLCQIAITKQPIANAHLFVKNTPNNFFIGRTNDSGQAVLLCNRMTIDKVIQINGFDTNCKRTFTLIAKDMSTGSTGTTEIDTKNEFQSIKAIIEL